MRRALTLALVTLCCGVGCKKAPTDGDRESGNKPFRIRVDAPTGRVGQVLSATITLEPRAPYKVNLEYPTKLTVSGPAAAAPRRLQLGKKDATRLDKAAGVFRPAVKLMERGEHEFSAIFKFSVCTEELCELLNEKLTWIASAK